MDPDSIEWPAALAAVPTLTILALLALAALLSSTESALLNVNRYRLRSLARLGNAAARRTELLLTQPDRLTTTILLCKVAVMASAIALTTLAAARFGGPAIVVSVAVLALLLLAFGDIAPRSLGVRYSQQLALATSGFYFVLVRLLHPLVWTITTLARALLHALGAQVTAIASISLSATDTEPDASGPSHQRMVARILELQSVSVEDIMVPRNEISSIDISDDWDSILDLLRTTPHTRLPVCEGNLDNVVGMLHMKKVAHALAHGEISRDALLRLAREREAYFVPAGTTLDMQLQNFQRDRRRIALVVDEYGDIRGLVTLEDILEEIVGEFTSDPGTLHKDIHRDSDGSYVVNGAVNVRVLNRTLGWSLPMDGPRTLNGLILEYLENIPEPGTSLKLGSLSIEILQAVDNAVKTARIRPILEDDKVQNEPLAQSAQK